jgi:hypothetical protein
MTDPDVFSSIMDEINSQETPYPLRGYGGSSYLDSGVYAVVDGEVTQVIPPTPARP